MILAYEFDCASENFAFFLKFYAQKSGLNFNLKKEHDLTTLYTEGSQEELLAFSDMLSNSLPHSVFLRSSKVYASQIYRKAKRANRKMHSQTSRRASLALI